MLSAAAVVVAVAAAALFTAMPGGEQCGTGWGAPCATATTDGSTVEIGATKPGGGSGPSKPRGGSAPVDAGPRYNPNGGGPIAVECPFNDDRYCVAPESVPVELRPTIDDVASFAPASVELLDQPDGVGVAGLPMNFVASVQAHTADGILFDVPVSVHFAPVEVVFDYGDGVVLTSTTGGATWEALGLPQFSATSTSHAYTARGTYTARAFVRYAAAYSFGAGWIPIDGRLTIPTTASSIEILEARTALVARTCQENPSGPGC